ncbi:HNH endonuclease [Streptomyces sp. HU2014]|uniref:HNH endonuclease n=1 Tax=Streptomyces sp. HU2014 TaxID=2939414 RepID=UPI00200DDC56|nr:HNH endonuclease [Streptomyces sp. HU2014]UQI44645.1 HNH endonuclease [Streptomyces sp. HU2014]
MPRAKSICLTARCPRVTVRAGRCETHAPPPRTWRTSARNKNRPGDFHSRRATVLARDRFTCQRCGSKTELEVDHLVPIAKGGTWELSNLWVLCATCHRQKTYYEDRA